MVLGSLPSHCPDELPPRILVVIMEQTPKALAEDKIYVLKEVGEKLGPFTAAVNSRKGIIEVFVKNLDVEVGDKILRPISSVKEEIYAVLDVHYESVTHGVFASYELDVRREGAPEKPKWNSSPTIHISNSQGIQIGDHNAQSVVNMLQELVSEIDKADAPNEQKTEAKNRLFAFLSHPIVSSVLGGAAGGLASELANKT